MSKPTVKTISFSALQNYKDCGWYYKLSNIDRLKPFESNPDTIFGTIVHADSQNILSNKISEEEAIKRFRRKWKKFCSLFKLEGFEHYEISGAGILAEIKNAFTEKFGKFKVIEIEYRIKSPADPYPQHFKGFIDLVLELENGTIVVVDLKTSISTYMFTEFQDRYKDYQLTLYKHFYGAEQKIDPKKIETYFVVLEKNSKSKKPVNFVRVTSGPKKVKNALEWLTDSLRLINTGVFLKNRFNCHAYGQTRPCYFYGTEHCPKHQYKS